MHSRHSVDLSIADDARMQGKATTVGASTQHVVIETRAGWINLWLSDDARRKLLAAITTPQEREALEAVHKPLGIVQ